MTRVYECLSFVQLGTIYSREFLSIPLYYIYSRRNISQDRLGIFYLPFELFFCVFQFMDVYRSVLFANKMNVENEGEENYHSRALAMQNFILAEILTYRLMHYPQKFGQCLIYEL